MGEIYAIDLNNLINRLISIDITVPPIDEGRTREHCERWNVCRLLASIANDLSSEFPIRITKIERPDFLLRTRQREIGIEITEVIQPDYARARVLPEARSGGSIIDPSLFKWGAPRKSLRELREIVSRKELTGPGWEGDEVEVEWSKAIFDSIGKKTDKLNSQGFQKFTENWLSVYDNANSFAVDIDKSTSLLINALKDYWSTSSFHRIYVETGKFIVSISEIEALKLPLNDLWK